MIIIFKSVNEDFMKKEQRNKNTRQLWQPSRKAA
jgi:hypothetical protein